MSNTLVLDDTLFTRITNMSKETAIELATKCINGLNMRLNDGDIDDYDIEYMLEICMFISLDLAEIITSYIGILLIGSDVERSFTINQQARPKINNKTISQNIKIKIVAKRLTKE